MTDHDKTFWNAIIENRFLLPMGYTVADLTPELMGYIGSPDKELRDEIAVEILTSWILGGYYNSTALRDMMTVWVGNLRVGIGENGTDTVLLRSFSALLLSIIAFYDWKEHFLTPEEYRTLLDSALRYARDEQDVRGYDEVLGWLHSPAHTADLLKFLSRNERAESDDLVRILAAAGEKITATRTLVFTHSEYDRLAWVVLDVVKRDKLLSAQLDAWLSGVLSVKAQDTGGYNPEYRAMYQNTKHFLRATYFLLAYLEESIPGALHLKDRIFEGLRQFQL